mgnify:FL=1
MRSLISATVVALVMVGCAPSDTGQGNAVETLAGTDGYSLPEFDQTQLLNRAAMNWTVMFAVYLDERMESGATPAEAGQAFSEIVGSSWTGEFNAISLFNAMYANWSMYPGLACEVTTAEEDQVEASCNRPYVPLFESSENDLYGTSLEEHEAAMGAFQAAIAELKGLNWDQSLEGGNLHVSITMD